MPPSGAAAVVSVSHDRHQTGGVRYVHRDESRLALFSGRPIRWTGAREADGRGPIDAASYLEPAERWAHELDGRFAVVRYDDASRVLEAVTDPMGAYPLFEARADGARWVSNSAELLRSLSGSTERDRAALAGLLGGGWSLDGHPLWASVRRLARASVHRLAAATAAERRELGTGRAIPASIGGGFDPDRAADLLVAATRCARRLARAPERRARHRRARLPRRARRGAPRGHSLRDDHRRRRRLAGRAGRACAGRRHRREALADPSRSERQRVGRLAAGGRDRAAHLVGHVVARRRRRLPARPARGPLPLWHSGQGGEIARSYYGTGHGLDRDGLVDRLTRAFLGRRPGRVDVLARRASARAWADRVVGRRPARRRDGRGRRAGPVLPGTSNGHLGRPEPRRRRVRARHHLAAVVRPAAPRRAGAAGARAQPGGVPPARPGAARTGARGPAVRGPPQLAGAPQRGRAAGGPRAPVLRRRSPPRCAAAPRSGAPGLALPIPSARSWPRFATPCCPSPTTRPGPCSTARAWRRSWQARPPGSTR